MYNEIVEDVMNQNQIPDHVVDEVSTRIVIQNIDSAIRARDGDAIAFKKLFDMVMVRINYRKPDKKVKEILNNVLDEL